MLKEAVEREGIPGRVLTVGDWLGRVTCLIAGAQLDGLEPGLAWLRRNASEETQPSVICHGDFHPLNILIGNGQVSGVIDWPWVRIAPPEYDVGATIAIITQGPVDVPGFLRGAGNVVRRWIARRYLQAYQRARPLDARALRYYEALRLLGFLVEAGQHRQGELGVIPSPEKPTAFGAQVVVNGIVSRFREITGVALVVP
jgi:aminoglycoside phosphotransferase (APT) family kinase protein